MQPCARREVPASRVSTFGLPCTQNGVCAVARRSEINADALVRLAQAVNTGEGALPPDLLGRLLDRVARLQRNVLEPRGLDVFGLAIDTPGAVAPAAALRLAEARRAARARRDYAEADRLRAEIEGLGWELQDGADGVRLIPKVR